MREPAPVRAMIPERVVAVDHRQDPGADGDGLAAQLVGVAGAVPVLVMVADDRHHRKGEPDRGDHVGAHRGVRLDDLELAGAQLAWLVQDVIGDPRFAVVVEQSGKLDRLLCFRIGDSHGLGQPDGELLDAPDMAARRRAVLGFGRHAQCLRQPQVEVFDLVNVLALILEADPRLFQRVVGLEQQGQNRGERDRSGGEPARDEAGRQHDGERDAAEVVRAHVAEEQRPEGERRRSGSPRLGEGVQAAVHEEIDGAHRQSRQADLGYRGLVHPERARGAKQPGDQVVRGRCGPHRERRFAQAEGRVAVLALSLPEQFLLERERQAIQRQRDDGGRPAEDNDDQERRRFRKRHIRFVASDLDGGDLPEEVHRGADDGEPDPPIRHRGRMERVQGVDKRGETHDEHGRHECHLQARSAAGGRVHARLCSTSANSAILRYRVSRLIWSTCAARFLFQLSASRTWRM